MDLTKHLLTLGLFFLCTSYSVQAQTTDCNNNFWTITHDGYIQQWSLNNDLVTGGDTLLSGGGTSLSYSGNGGTSVFFSNNYSPIGITYYDPNSGWVDIPTSVVVDNGGGHLNGTYYMNEGAVIQVIKYWDGANLLTVDSLNGNFFAGTFDIAVDTLGQAWVFTGPAPSIVNSLNVYTPDGLIKSYAIQFDAVAYGSFFLNNTLYIGTDQDAIFPILINVEEAELGNPIPFSNPGFTDMASCHTTGSTTSTTGHLEEKLKLFPNPTDGYLTLLPTIETSKITVYDSQGQIISPIFSGSRLDLTEQPSGIYFIKIDHADWPGLYKIIKR